MHPNIQRLLLGWLLLALCPGCYSFQVVFLDKADSTSPSSQQVGVATNFYGLRTARFIPGNGDDIAHAMRELRQPSTSAVIVDAATLPALDQRQVFGALRRERTPRIPILVVGITTETAQSTLRQWSADAVSGCQPSYAATGKWHYEITTIKDLTREISGQELMASPGQTCSLVVDSSKAEPIMKLSFGSAKGSVFVRTQIADQEVFFASEFKPDDAVPPADEYDQPVYQFTRVAPMAIFLRYSAGERVWHSTGHYANLTIDDALLREPYGYVRYRNLLQEMQGHNFHTTIAFIPWNYDRSEPDVVSLFREHSDRFSISIHGDNHDHLEFPSIRDKSLALQTVNIRQALVRMEVFRKLTGIPYDRVMVFPHSIAPAETLGALKRANYLATVNSQNVPKDSTAPADKAYALRAVTLAFGNFPSLRRYSAEYSLPSSELAVDAFLGNPLLFYVHQGYFAGGPARFDSIADEVNRIEPTTQWRGLGYISERLHLERSREDGNYDVKAFSNTLYLENTHDADAVFFVEKKEDFQLPLLLSVDGQPYPYTRDDDGLHFEVRIGRGLSRNITIKYRGDSDLGPEYASKASLRVAALRYLSEFRDNVVSRSAIGRKIITAYTNHETASNRFIGALLVILGLTALTTIRRLVFQGSKVEGVARPEVTTRPSGKEAPRTRSTKRI